MGIKRNVTMYFSKRFCVFSIFALAVVAPGVSFATAGDGTIVTSKLYVDNQLGLKQDKLPYNATNKVIITPTTDGGAAGTRDITTAGTGITGLANSSATGATNIPTAYAVKEAISGATNGMITDVSGKQDKDNTQVYKVGQNGNWAAITNAVDAGDYATKAVDATTGAVTINVSGTTDTTLAGNGETAKLPTAATVKTYVDNAISAQHTTDDGAYQPKTGAGANNQIGMANGTWYTMVDGTNTVVTDDSTNNQVKIDVAGVSGFTNVNGGTNADNAKLPTAAAVKTYADAKVSSANSISSSSTTTAPNEKAVNDALVAKQTKPSSGVANGKVLTYTGTDANANVSAAYVTVPVATAAPSTVTPSGFAEIWVQ